MRDATTVLGIIRDRGARGLPLEDVYRQLFNPALYLLAYGKISANAGALTPGATPETADGMSREKIQAIIDLLKYERYRWTPVRRVFVEKKNSLKKRPLGLPTWSDKLLQEVIRLILEAYYEPQFSPRSHGFRPQRGCHTALTEIHRTWNGTTWFIEGDISGCFDALDHGVLMAILAEKIHDNRFLRLLANLLKAGYLEAWRYHQTLSGSPQGGIVSPILANLYLDRLDQFVETVLIPEHTQGHQRRKNPAYHRLVDLHVRAKQLGDVALARAVRKRYQTLPWGDPRDPAYRKLRYIRYADDLLLGFTGPHREAEAIKQQLSAFLSNELKLTLSDSKTLVTHGRTEAARFLGYELVVLHDDGKRTRGQRSINGVVGLRVPLHTVQEKCQAYMRHGKPIHRTERMNESVFAIITRYAAEFRGLAEYYRMAYNLHRLNRLKWTMETSLTKTLAAKLQLSVPQVYRRFHATLRTERGTRSVLVARVEREGKRPLVATWGQTDLVRRADAILTDTLQLNQNRRHELVERLMADTCELCGS